MEFKKIAEMTNEELSQLPQVAVRVSRLVLKDRKSSKITGVRFEALVNIHPLLVKRVTISQAAFGLLAVASGKQSANELNLNAYIHYTKGSRKNGEKYYLYEARVSSDVTIRDFLSIDEAKLLSSLKKSGQFVSEFYERPEDTLPEVAEDSEEVTI